MELPFSSSFGYVDECQWSLVFGRSGHGSVCRSRFFESCPRHVNSHVLSRSSSFWSVKGVSAFLSVKGVPLEFLWFKGCFKRLQVQEKSGGQGFEQVLKEPARPTISRETIPLSFNISAAPILSATTIKMPMKDFWFSEEGCLVVFVHGST